MAKYYNYTGRVLSNIKLALDDYYGINITYYVNTTDDLIFLCPLICDKVMRFYLVNTTVIACQIGTWDGSAFTNITDFAGSYFPGSSSYGYTASYEIVCGDTFMVISAKAGGSYSTRITKFLFVGKTTENRYFVAGFCFENYSAYVVGYKTTFTDVLADFTFKGLSDVFQNYDGTLFKSILLMEDKTSGLIIVGSSGFETLKDFYLASKRSGTTSMTKGAGYVLLPSGYYDNNYKQLVNSILIEGLIN